MTHTQFVSKFCEILGEDFFLSDMIWQEELFEKQDGLCKLICEGANKNLPLAKQMAKKFPLTFNIS
jgi:hypothetical protein